MAGHKGKYKPKNPQKYKGDIQNIVWRSTWELRLMKYLDLSSSILWWNSESVIIPYISPVDGKTHRYFPDFLICAKTKDGNTKKILIEVKPKAQTKPPQKRSRKTQKYLNEVKTYSVNQAKWKSALNYCKKRGWEFSIMTEDTLGKF